MGDFVAIFTLFVLAIFGILVYAWGKREEKKER
jgi:hypothetical protein